MKYFFLAILFLQFIKLGSAQIIANFTWDDPICAGSNVTFTDASSGNDISEWVWSINGLTPLCDNFSDGDFTTSPNWIGNTDKYIVNYNNELQLYENPQVEGISYLSTPSYSLINSVWEFSVKMQFNPSSSNYCEVFLCSNTSDLTTTTNGYFVKIGNTADEVSLYRKDASSSTMIIDGTNGRLNTTAVNLRVKVTRDYDGNWSLMSDTLGGTDYYIEGICFDDNYLSSNYFGFKCVYTATRSQHFFFDNIGTLSSNIFAYNFPDVIEPTIYNIGLTATDGVVSDNIVKPITVFPRPVLTYNQEDVICFGQNNGSATVIASGSQEPYFYLWNTDEITSSITELSAISYSVTVTDANTCSSTVSILINSPEEFSYTVTPDQSICNGSEAEISVNAIGGVEPYTYIWNDAPELNVESRIVSPSNDESYMVSVLDNNLCTYSEQSTTITVIQLDTTIVTDLFCINDTYNFFDQIIDEPGTYYHTLTSIQTGCDSIIKLELSLFSAPFLFLGEDVLACDGNSVELHAGSFDSYLWSNSSIDETIQVFSSGDYSVTVTDTNGCQTSDTVNIDFIFPPTTEICFVEFDTITHKNRIVWATPPINAAAINIYSEIATDVYSLIGSVPASQTSYIDMNSNPQNMSYSYKITINDTCDNEGSQSAFHKTITLLSAYDQPTNTYGFTWSAYEGISVANYFIYGITSTNSVIQIASVPGNTYFYNYSNPSPLFVKYFVGFYTVDCNAKSDYMVKSNLVNSNSSILIGSTKKIDLWLYPNPTKDKIIVHTPELNYEIEIINIFGQVLFNEKNSKEINVENYAPGTYILKFSGDEFKRLEKIIVY